MPTTMSVTRRWVKTHMAVLGHSLGRFKRDKHSCEERYAAKCTRCNRSVFIVRQYVPGRKRKYYSVGGQPIGYTCTTLMSTPYHAEATFNILPEGYFPS